MNHFMLGHLMEWQFAYVPASASNRVRMEEGHHCAQPGNLEIR
jgi:hypothetical protein